MAFAQRLQEVRRRSGLTQEQFAERLCVSRQAVSKWESGRGYPEIEKILYICSCYGVTLNELFDQGAAAALRVVGTGAGARAAADGVAAPLTRGIFQQSGPAKQVAGRRDSGGRGRAGPA